MRYLKKPLAFLVAMLVPFALVSSANAAGETVTANTTLSAKGGKFFKQVGVASDLKVDVEVNTPPSSPSVNPMKNVKITFPAGMTFRPNNKKTPVCSDAKLNVGSNLSNPKGVVDSCARSVVGTGTAAIYLAKVNAPQALITDPILVAFNAGKTGQGQPKLKIYGYSKTTNVGILMDGVLRGRVLDIAVPVLSNDSAVKTFTLQLPGPVLDRADLGINVRGLDPNYVQARCSSSPLTTNAVFELGERAYPSGTPTGPTTTVVAPQTTQNCNGLAGRARLAMPRLKGPNAVKRGRVGTFRITVRNNGTAVARNVVVTSNRGGKRKVGKIAPRTAKTIALKVRIRGRKNSRVAVRFLARSGNVKVAKVKRVRVR